MSNKNPKYHHSRNKTLSGSLKYLEVKITISITGFCSFQWIKNFLCFSFFGHEVDICRLALEMNLHLGKWILSFIQLGCKWNFGTKHIFISSGFVVICTKGCLSTKKSGCCNQFSQNKIQHKPCPAVEHLHSVCWCLTLPLNLYGTVCPRVRAFT